MPSPAVAVRLQNVSKYYKLYDSKRDRFREAFDLRRRKRHREFYALRGIDLEIKKGEILGVVGRNGAGKSTLLKILSGVLQANSGQVEVNGRVSALLELGAGLNPNLDGIQNIYFGGIMMGFSREEMKRRLEEIVAFADIGEFINQPMRTYSSGMRARLGFALAIHMKPEILVVDEVLSVGDELFRRKCYARMEEMFKSNCTILYVTHNMNTITEICSRAVLIDQGIILLEGSPKLVTLSYEKFLFGNPDNRENIKKELLILNKQKNKETAPSKPANEPANSESSLFDNCDAVAVRKKGKKTSCIHEAVYLDNFQTKSKKIFKNKNIDVLDLHVSTQNGKRVNYLFPHDYYYLNYGVKFAEEAENIVFSCVFKTEKGLVLSGVRYPTAGKTIERVIKNTVYSVKLRFKCMFLPGNYYIDFGVVGFKGEKKHVLSAEYDALVLKIQNCKCLKNETSSWAYISMEPEIEIAISE